MTRAFSTLLFCLSLTLLGQACFKGKPNAAADASTNQGPAVRVQGSQVLVDGEVAGTTRAIEDLGRLQKIDELFERLKKQREEFKAANPSTPFPGKATIGVDGDAPVIVFKSVFQTAAFAGYPYLLADVAVGDSAADAKSGFVPVAAIIPGPPGETFAPRVAVHVRLSGGAIEVSEDRGEKPAREEHLDLGVSEAEVRERVKTAVVDRFLRHDLRANPSVDVIVHADNSVPYKRLAAVFRGLAQAHERLAGPGDTAGAFVIRLAMS